MSEDPQMIYEHGEPTGHTSWGPDPDLPTVREAFEDVKRSINDSVPEPTEAMVEAARKALFSRAMWPNETSVAITAAIAAAPPEWLLRAALTEDEMLATQFYLAGRADGDVDAVTAATKLGRALRGGEEET